MKKISIGGILAILMVLTCAGSAFAAPPNKPTNVWPSDGATDVELSDTTLQSSPFYDPDPGNTHYASAWYFRTPTDWGSTGTTEYLLAFPIESYRDLDYSTTYYWRVRHTDNNLEESEWSDETSFTTVAAPTTPPNAPTLLTVKPINAGPANSTISIRWQDNSEWESGFSIETMTPEGNWTEIHVKERDATVMLDWPLEWERYYFYRIRAFYSNGVYSEYSNVKGTYIPTVLDGGGGGGGGCFIATAAYGTPMAGELDTLRGFRDEYLLTNAVGEALVESYYSVSPPIADFIADSETLRAVVRAGLAPVVMTSQVALHMQWMMVVSLVVVCFAVGAWARQRRRQGLA
jgi:hypothetical protein